MRDYKPDDGNGHCILTAGIRAAGIGRSAVKCNCHRLKYLLLYYKSVIALILWSIVPCSISYWYTAQDNIPQY